MARWTYSIAIWGLYAAALFTPVIEFYVLPTSDGGPARVWGHQVLLEGEFWRWPGTLAESANLALLLGWMAYLKMRPKVSLTCGMLGVLLAVTAPMWYRVAWGDLRAGYYLWAASMVVLTIAAFVDGRGQRSGSANTLTRPPHPRQS